MQPSTKRDRRKVRDGRSWCYFGMALGGSISVYANVAAKHIHNATPELDGVVLAAAAPVVLWVMLEILIRVRGGGAAAWVVRAMSALVALVAFVTSYQHLHDLLVARDESTLTACAYPLGIDGLLVGAAVVLWQMRTVASRRARPTPVPGVEDGEDGVLASSPSSDPVPVLEDEVVPVPVPSFRPQDGPEVEDEVEDVPSSGREDGPQDGPEDGPAPSSVPSSSPVPVLTSIPTPCPVPSSTEDGTSPAVLRAVERAREAIARGDLPRSPSRDELKTVLQVGTSTATAARRILAETAA